MQLCDIFLGFERVVFERRVFAGDTVYAESEVLETRESSSKPDRGIVHPEPEFHAAMRKLTRKYGTMLILDETHTICAGPGGYTRAENLEPGPDGALRAARNGSSRAFYGSDCGHARERDAARARRHGAGGRPPS